MSCQTPPITQSTQPPPPRSAAARIVVVAGLLLAGACDDGGATGDAGPPDVAPDTASPAPIVDIRADVNRNGVVDLTDPTEDADEDRWDSSHGAIFLANLDDDDQSCPKAIPGLSDDALAACNDAADEALDGADDLKDLAPLRTVPWPAAPEGVVGTVKLSLPGAAATASPGSYVRLFRKDGASVTALKEGETFDAAALRRGVELWLEGKDIVRDASVWDGYVDVTLEVQLPADGPARSERDTVRLRVAPLLTSHHLQAMDTLYVTGSNDMDSVAFRAGLAAATKAASVPHTVLIGTWDQWTQDFFETGWMSMPAAGGAPHVVTVFVRSANVDDPENRTTPLRQAGRVVFDLRGPDRAAVQQYDTKHPGDMDSLNSLGNLETIPPYDNNGRSYPMGRMTMGKVSSFYPTRSFTTMLEAQKVQPPLWIDTSWLLVGHVDETITYLKASSARGWALGLNDPALAREMLQDASDAGDGATVMFEGKYWSDGYKDTPAQATIDEVLADTEVMAASATAAVEVAAQLALLKKETGITDAEILRFPFLHYTVDGYSVAYQPGTVNGVVLSDTHYVAPEPHGPVIGGVDIFKKQLDDELAQNGITVHYVENWDLYHRLLGEVHCGTNALRVVPTGASWWEAGR